MTKGEVMLCYFSENKLKQPMIELHSIRNNYIVRPIWSITINISFSLKFSANVIMEDKIELIITIFSLL